MGGVVTLVICALVALVYVLDRDVYYVNHLCCDTKLCESGTGIPRCANAAHYGESANR